jgi:hypothetical protein
MRENAACAVHALRRVKHICVKILHVQCMLCVESSIYPWFVCVCVFVCMPREKRMCLGHKSTDTLFFLSDTLVFLSFSN